MNKELAKILKDTKFEPNNGLEERVYSKVLKKEKYLTRIKLYLFSFLGLISLVGFIPAIKMLLSDFTQSGFYEYSSLLFSKGALFSAGKELILSVVESLPTLSILLPLALIFIFIMSLRYAMKQIIRGQLSLSF